MNNHNHHLKTSTLSLALAAAAFSLAGCADRTSHVYGYYDGSNAPDRESLRSSMPSAAEIAPAPDEVGRRQIPPANVPHSPQSSNLEKPRNAADDRAVDPEVDPALAVAPPYYMTSVRNRMGQLFRQIMRIQADAKVKGTAAQTAVTPPTIDFAKAQDQIEAGLDLGQLACDGGDWDSIRLSIDACVKDAEVAVIKAERALAKAPSFPLGPYSADQRFPGAQRSPD